MSQEDFLMRRTRLILQGLLLHCFCVGCLTVSSQVYLICHFCLKAGACLCSSDEEAIGVLLSFVARVGLETVNNSVPYTLKKFD